MFLFRTSRRALRERLGLGPAALRTANPRLVTCSISGYGAGGAAGQRKAYDLLIQPNPDFSR